MSKRVNLKAIHFDGDASQPGGVNTANSDLVTVLDQDIFTWSDSTSMTTGTNHKPMSVSCWFNPSQVSEANRGMLVSKFSHSTVSGNGDRGSEWLLWVTQNGRLQYALYDSAVHTTLNKLVSTSAVVVSANQWQHVVVTFGGNPTFDPPTTDEGGNFVPDTVGGNFGIKIYYNGQEAAMQADQTVHRADPGYVITRNTKGLVAIGAADWDRAGGTPDHFNTLFEGKIADTCIFNRELSAAEAQEIYNGGKVKDMTKHSAYSSLISWWKMGDDLDHSGTNGIIDYVSGFHGSLHGQANITTDPSLPTDRIRLQNHAHSSWGRTRQPKNLAGDHQIYIHGGQSGNMPKTDPSGTAAGYSSENQRYLHTYWKAEQTNKTHEITVFGYSYAMGTWSLLHDVSGNQIKLNISNAAVDQYKIFEISGVDRIYFKSTGTHDLLSTDLFAAAASSM